MSDDIKFLGQDKYNQQNSIQDHSTTGGHPTVPLTPVPVSGEAVEIPIRPPAIVIEIQVPNLLVPGLADSVVVIQGETPETVAATLMKLRELLKFGPEGETHVQAS